MSTLFAVKILSCQASSTLGIYERRRHFDRQKIEKQQEMWKKNLHLLSNSLGV